MSTIYHEGSIAVRSCDTDVLIVSLTHASSLGVCVTRRYMELTDPGGRGMD